MADGETGSERARLPKPSGGLGAGLSEPLLSIPGKRFPKGTPPPRPRSPEEGVKAAPVVEVKPEAQTLLKAGFP